MWKKPRIVKASAFAALALAVAAGAWHWQRGRGARPIVAPGHGIFIADFEGVNASGETERLTAALRAQIGKDPFFGKNVEIRRLGRKLDASDLESVRELAESLNADVLIGAGNTGTGAGDAFMALRLPPSKGRADLQRLEARLAYPELIVWRISSPESWDHAARIAKAHVSIAAGREAGALAPLTASGKEPPKPIDPGLLEAEGTLALAAGIGGSPGASTYQIAQDRLERALKGFTETGQTAFASRASAHLASAMIARAEIGAQTLDTNRTLALLDAAAAKQGERLTQWEPVARLLYALTLLNSRQGELTVDALRNAYFSAERAARQWTAMQKTYGPAFARIIQARTLTEAPGATPAQLQQALDLTNTALQTLTRNPFPSEWALAQETLGNIYARRAEGDRAQNLRLSREAYDGALEVWRVAKADASMRGALVGRSVALLQLQGNSPDENFEAAMRDLNEALVLTPKSTAPEEWARIRGQMGTVARRMSGGKSEARFREAIENYEAALEVYQPEKYPVPAARLLNNLANAYRDFPGGDRRHYLEQAMAAYQAALEALTFGSDSKPAIEIQRNRDGAQRMLELLEREAVPAAKADSAATTGTLAN